MGRHTEMFNVNIFYKCNFILFLYFGYDYSCAQMMMMMMCVCVCVMSLTKLDIWLSDTITERVTFERKHCQLTSSLGHLVGWVLDIVWGPYFLLWGRGFSFFRCSPVHPADPSLPEFGM